MTRTKFFEFAKSVSVDVATKLAIANGISKTQVELWALQVKA